MGSRFWILAFLTILLSSAGFALFHFEFIGYGFTFFLVTPLIIGFFLGQKLTFKISAFFAVFVGLVAFMYLLITAQLEGIFCVITLFPLIALLIFIGSMMGYFIREFFDKRNRSGRMTLTFAPLLILLLSAQYEEYFFDKYSFNKVETEMFIKANPLDVYNAIKSVDTLDSPKPFLLQLGLPVPQKCILEKDSVGASRICVFKNGTIDEIVEEIKPAEVLKMKVLRYNLEGRKWLKFDEASYYFKEVPGGTIIKRITSYRTELKPRWYWKFWEENAIESEHEFVLSDLVKRLKNNSGND